MVKPSSVAVLRVPERPNDGIIRHRVSLHLDGDSDMTGLTVTSGEAIDAKAFWMTLGQRATGMTVVTADSDDGPTGFLGLSAAHVTASPPTMLVSVDRKTSALAGIRSRRHFAVNFLPANAAGVADAFGGRAGVSGAARFTPGEWRVLSTGAPVFCDALGVSTVSLRRYWNAATSSLSSAKSSRFPRATMAIR
jgi:flavin reductase (DIM6/NTAB) family NADH-FMN oxidoreductase RutF